MLGEQAILVRAADDEFVGWTAAAARLFGRPTDASIGPRLCALLPRGAAADGAPVTLAMGSGHHATVSWTQLPLHDASGKLVAFVDLLVPVSAVSADALLIAAARSQDAQAGTQASAVEQVLESLPMLCWIASSEGACRFMSSRWTEFTGLSVQHLLGAGWEQVIHPDDLSRCYEALRTALDRPLGTPLVEMRMRRHDGHYRWFEVRAAPQYDAQGRVTCWVGATLEVHDVHVAREALQRGRARLERIVAAAPGAFYSGRMAPDGALSLPYVSEAMQELLGITAQEINAGLAMLAHVHPDDHARVCETVQQSARALRPWQLDYRMLSATRGTIWVQASAVPMREPDGGIQWYGFLQDVTARKRSEEVQLRVQKLEALATLAGGIAHDFNNMLHAVAGNCALARRMLPPEHPARALLDTAGVAGERAAELVRRLLQFSRPTEVHREVQSLRAIVREALRLVRATVPARIEIHEELGDDDPYVDVEAAQVHQIILHLASNAAHAIGDASGVLRVRLERVPAPTEQVAGATLPAGERAALHITDSGVGMDETLAARIFDPFFTTKRVGEGTGLGLSLVHAIMTSLGGSITVRSAPGEGSTFTLCFPVVAPAPSLSADAGLHEVHAEGCVLLVDDEPLLVELGAHALQALGYEVRGFTCPRDALRAFFVDPASIDLVITDLAMPDLSGFEVARRLLEARPGLPIVMMSGNVSAQEITEARKLGVHEVLLKPVSLDTLGRTVEAAIRAGRARTKPTT